jgi:hypothetical protein
MEVISLKNPYPNGFEDKEDPSVLSYIDNLLRVRKAIEEGNAYIRYIDGDRKGSVAKLKFDSDYTNSYLPEVSAFRYTYNLNAKFKVDNDRFYCVATWKGRSNKVKVSLPGPQIEVIIGDDVETVYKMFDHKAAKEEILKSPNQKDIDGNILSVGDNVMFINISYGSRMYLQRGVITGFKVVANSKSSKITTVIENEQGIKSELNYPQDMVHKIS